MAFELKSEPNVSTSEGRGGGPPPESDWNPLKGWLGTPVTMSRWQLLAAGTVLVVVVVAISQAITAARVDGLRAEADQRVAAQQAEVDELEGDLQRVRGDVADAERDAERAEDRADSADRRARAKAEDDLADRSEQLDQRAQALDARERDLEEREEAVGLREAFVEQNSFGNGRFEVGADIQAGKYRTDGGSGCYWAKLRSSDSQDIRSNHFGSGPQTVVIDSPWFESQDCGTWTLVS